MRIAVAATALALACAPAAGAASQKVDYGPISHKGLKKVGSASASSKLALQLGFVADQSGLQKAVKAASDPTSSSYGKYPSLSKLAGTYGASSSKRKGVVNAFKQRNVTATVDVPHLRASAGVSIGKAQQLFGTKWAVYKDSSTGARVALPVDTPKLPKGIKGNVDTIAGMRLQVGASPTIASLAPWPSSPPACSAAMPCAVSTWLGNRPRSESAALGKDAGVQPSAGVPVRVGVPPSTAGAGAAGACDDFAPTCSRMPAIVSTFPLMPFGSLGVSTGRATRAPVELSL